MTSLFDTIMLDNKISATTKAVFSAYASRRQLETLNCWTDLTENGFSKTEIIDAIGELRQAEYIRVDESGVHINNLYPLKEQLKYRLKDINNWDTVWNVAVEYVAKNNNGVASDKSCLIVLNKNIEKYEQWYCNNERGGEVMNAI